MCMHARLVYTLSITTHRLRAAVLHAGCNYSRRPVVYTLSVIAATDQDIHPGCNCASALVCSVQPVQYTMVSSCWDPRPCLYCIPPRVVLHSSAHSEVSILIAGINRRRPQSQKDMYIRGQMLTLDLYADGIAVTGSRTHVPLA